MKYNILSLELWNEIATKHVTSVGSNFIILQYIIYMLEYSYAPKNTYPIKKALTSILI